MKETTKLSTIASFPTVECSDCVETCPFNKSIVTCSTYQLHTNVHDGKQHHTGIIYHLQIIDNSFKLLDTISELQYGIFDMKYNNNYPLLAVCQTNNTISIYSLDEEFKKLILECVYKFDEEVTMITSIDWSDCVTKTTAINDIKLICGDSIGRVQLLNLNRQDSGEYNITIDRTIKGHDAEC